MSNSSSDATPPAVVIKSVQDNRPQDFPKVQHTARPKVFKAAAQTSKEDKLAKLVSYLDRIREKKFTGYIKVNFSQGAIGRIERFEEILSK
jgi:hypothetical protein